MREPSYARIVFGVSAAAAGIAGLLSHGAWLAWCLAIAQVLGGLALLYPRSARAASIVLGAVYLISSLATVPGMIAAPADYVQYVDFFEKFSIVCGALAAFARSDEKAVQSGTLPQAARLLFGICTASFAWAQIVYFKYTASLVPVWIPPNQQFWTWLTTAAFALAALAILVNRQVLLALRLMTLMLALFGVLVWVPHIVAHPRTLSNWTEISSNYLMTAAAWLIADLYRRVPSVLRELRA